MARRALLGWLTLLPAFGAAAGPGNPVQDNAPFPFDSLEGGVRYLADTFQPVPVAEGVTLYFDEAKIHAWHLLEGPDGKSRAIIRSRTGRKDGRIVDLYRIQCEGLQAWCQYLVGWHETNLRENPPPPPPPELMDLL